MCSEESTGCSDSRMNEGPALLAFVIFNASRVVYVQNLTQPILHFLDRSCPMEIEDTYTTLNYLVTTKKGKRNKWNHLFYLIPYFKIMISTCK